MKNNEFDMFYTNPKVSDYIVEKIFSFFPSIKSKIFLEPSAGTGNFINSLIKNNIPLNKIKAYDINPQSKFKIIKKDFMKVNLKNQKFITIGNPPFGKRGKTALDFLNKCLNHSYFVIFILPNTFKRFLMQKQVNINCKLLYEENLQPNSFIVNDFEYNVNCVFQVWCNELNCKNFIKTYLTDKRKKQNFSLQNSIVKTWIYNNTSQTRKYFDKKKYLWDFAVHRQGYYDYSKKIYDCNELFTNRQYFFIKILDKKYEQLIKNIDFTYLSKKNTITPGFSASDFYEELENKIKFFDFFKG